MSLVLLNNQWRRSRFIDSTNLPVLVLYDLVAETEDVENIDTTVMNISKRSITIKTTSPTYS